MEANQHSLTNVCVVTSPFPPHQIAMSSLQMGKTPMPGHYLGVFEPKQRQGQCGTLNTSLVSLSSVDMPWCSCHDTAGASSHPSSPAALYTTVGNIHTPQSGAAPPFLHLGNLHRLKKPGRAAAAHGQIDTPEMQSLYELYPLTPTSSPPPQGKRIPPTPVFPLMVCISIATSSSSFLLPGLRKEVHLQ